METLATQAPAALVVVYLIEHLVKPFLGPLKDSKPAKRFLGFLAAVFTATGIEYTVTGAGFELAGTWAGLATGLWAVLSQWALQQGAWDAIVSPKRG